MKWTTSAGLLALVAIVGLSGCVGSSEARRGGPQAAFAGPVVNWASEVQPRVVGRVAPTEDGGVQMAWAGTSASVKFHGSAVSADITDNGKNHYLVLIDGQPLREKITPSEGRTTVELAKGLPRGEHTVTLYKLNEPLVGTATLHGFILDESARPLANDVGERRRIEILGDSISAGYGNEGENETCPFAPETENHFLTYGARAARELDADLSTIAWSGKGVFTNRGSTSDTKTLPELWDKTLPAEGVEYDFSAPAPSAVIINLGTNDFAPEVADFSPFGPSYDAFLSEVRKRYSSSHLFVMIGPLLTDDYPPGREALTKARAALTEIVERRVSEGDAKLHLFEVSRATPEEGFGCDYHPSAKTHARMAATVVRLLREKAGF